MPDSSVIQLPGVRIAGAVAAGGAVGSVLRYAVTLWLPDDPIGFGVVAANLAGAFLLGLAVGRTAGPPRVAFWQVGVLGSFTTFSAMMAQAVSLPAAAATAYTVGLLLLGVGCAGVGLRLSGGRGGRAAGDVGAPGGAPPGRAS